jgi:hypothetical protein
VVYRKITRPNETFSIVSFNVKVGGSKKAQNESAIKQIADIVRQGDIAVLQEVTHKSFAISLLNYLMPLGFHGAYKDLPEGEDKEEVFFLYNKKKVKFRGIHAYTSEPRLFQREPTTALFEIDHKTLGVMNYHAKYKKGNSEELLNLPTAVDDSRIALGIVNIVIAADTNLGSDGILLDPYYSNFGMCWPQRFPKPGVCTTNGRESATYDYIFWDGTLLVPKSSKIIKYYAGTRFVMGAIDEDNTLRKLFPKERKRLRKKIINVSDHWGIKVEFYLGNDYSLDDLNNMPLLNCLPLYALRTLRRFPTMGYDFPGDLHTRYRSSK